MKVKNWNTHTHSNVDQVQIQRIKKVAEQKTKDRVQFNDRFTSFINLFCAQVNRALLQYRPFTTGGHCAPTPPR